MKLLYISLLTFVFVASAALALTGSFNLSPKEEVSHSQKNFVPLPVISKSSTFPIVSAQAALAIDMDSQVTLYEKNPDSPLLPASTTKIITALVAMETYPLDSILKVGNIKIDGQKMWLR